MEPVSKSDIRVSGFRFAPFVSIRLVIGFKGQSVRDPPRDLPAGLRSALQAGEGITRENVEQVFQPVSDRPTEPTEHTESVRRSGFASRLRSSSPSGSQTWPPKIAKTARIRFHSFPFGLAFVFQEEEPWRAAIPFPQNRKAQRERRESRRALPVVLDPAGERKTRKAESEEPEVREPRTGLPSARHWRSRPSVFTTEVRSTQRSEVRASEVRGERGHSCPLLICIATPPSRRSAQRPPPPSLRRAACRRRGANLRRGCL